MTAGTNAAHRVDPTPRDDRTAVILNKNAKRVGERVRRRVLEAAPDADVFFTESLEQAAFVSRRVIEQGYGTVVTGGGDGTIINTIQQILDEVDAGHGPRPRFGVLKLGTGNAVADFLGARRFDQDLSEFDAADSRPVDLLRLADGRRTLFGGLGWDAFILDNYDRMRRAAERFAVTRALFKSVAGYLIAGIGKSVPEFLIKRPRWHVRVINTGGMARRVDVDGNVLERFAPGAVVYDGPMRMACFGTTPFYGFKMNIMPHADRAPGMFHLRLLDMSPLTAVRSLPQAWNGRLAGKGVHDLLLSSCRLEFDQEAPLQLGGDAAGRVKTLDLSVDDPIECLHFAQ